MELYVKTTYTKDLINKAAVLHWKKIFAPTFFISVLGVTIALILIFYFNSKDWISGSFLIISFISSAIFAWSFFIFKNRSMAIYEEMESPVVNWRFTEESIIAESDIGKSEFKWGLLKGIVKSNDIWLLIYKNNSYSTFPLVNVSSDVLAFISKKVNESNDKIT